jgi:putative hydrolase of the HAD superfamily
MDISLVLFDLGGVLYNIEHAWTRNQLVNISSSANCNLKFNLEQADPIFAQYDAGKIDTKQFLQALRKDYALHGTDEEILHAWNAMLLGLYPDSLALATLLGNHVNIALLSNINECHHQYIEDACSELFAQFHHLFLSYKLGMKKPDPEIFEYVIDQTGYPANSILFLDDTPKNCQIAKTLGIHSRLIDPHSRVWVKEIVSQFM